MVVVFSKPNMPNFKYELIRNRQQADQMAAKWYPGASYKVYSNKQAMELRATDGSRMIKPTITYSEFEKRLSMLNE